MKHSGISMRDVMEFAEYLDDCGATLQHAAIRKSRSKYKGGFINGKNTSEYNHDYYIHNRDKWSSPYNRKQFDHHFSDKIVAGSGTRSDPYIRRFNTYKEYRYYINALENSPDRYRYDRKSKSWTNINKEDGDGSNRYVYMRFEYRGKDGEPPINNKRKAERSRSRKLEILHSGTRRTGSKYKGGFKSVNGRLNNTSEYNHDYYVHNKDKWNKESGVRTGSGTEEDPYVIRYNNPGDYKYASDWMRTNKDAWIYDKKSNSYIPTEGNPFVPQGHYRAEYNGPNKVSGRSRNRSVTRSMDPNEPMGTFYTFNNGKTSMYSPKNLRGTGSGGKKDPEYNKRNRPHSRKRGEATASGKVFRRPEIYNPLTGEYESYTLGRGHGNNGNKKNPTRSTAVTRSMPSRSNEEKLPKDRTGKYKTSNTRRSQNVNMPASSDKKGTRYVDKDGLVWVKGDNNRWTTMKNGRVSIKTAEELRNGTPIGSAYRRLRNRVVGRK